MAPVKQKKVSGVKIMEWWNTGRLGFKAFSHCITR
jgi:hypothetical protein